MTPPLSICSGVQILSERIDKPELDDRSYRLIKLTGNNLQVLLVHDPLTEKSSAAVDVNVGSQSDPKDFQGLAHALEHCLFLGSPSHNRMIRSSSLPCVCRNEKVSWGERLFEIPERS